MLRLRQLDLVAAADARRLLVLDAPVVVVDGDREDLLGLVLADDVVVEERADLARRRAARRSGARSVSVSSSSMISLQRSMHSSQMYTPGPAMSFLTCFCDLPQNEHFSSSPVSPNFATVSSSFARSRSVCRRRSADRTGAVDGVARRDHIVDDAIREGLFALP